MPITTDSLIERIKLKGRVQLWRSTAIILLAALLIMLADSSGQMLFSNGHIARVDISGIIGTGKKHSELMDDLSKDDKVKAVIVHVDTPGGAAVGGEKIYNSLKALSEKKPVVVVMESMATSAGYLISVGAERIYAHKGTITGSIGVILQSPNINELAKKIGIEMEIIKTGDLKGVPSLFEKLTPEGQIVMQKVVNSFQNVFIGIISKERNIDRKEVIKIADGRVFTGLQALGKKLIDAIGGEKEAIVWLNENKNLDPSMEIIDVEPKSKKPDWEDIVKSTFSGKDLLPKSFSMHGLLSIWQNSVIN